MCSTQKGVSYLFFLLLLLLFLAWAVENASPKRPATKANPLHYPATSVTAPDAVCFVGLGCVPPLLIDCLSVHNHLLAEAPLGQTVLARQPKRATPTTAGYLDSGGGDYFVRYTGGMCLTSLERLN